MSSSQRSSPKKGSSPQRSQSGSQSGKPSFPPTLGYDPAKPAVKPEQDRGNTRLDLPPEAYMSAERLKNPGFQPFAKRPGFNKTGTPVPLEINQFKVASWSTDCRIYQFDISISPIPLKQGPVFKKCWAHPDVRKRLERYKTRWLCDGRKLAWGACPIERGEERITVDLDSHLPPRADGKPRRDNTFYFIIRQTAQIDLSHLDAYLSGKTDWSNKVLECMNFLDHVVRQFPSEHLLQIKRNFYARQPSKAMVFPISDVVELIKGVYASVRMNQSGRGIGLNVDVANTAFWVGGQNMATFIKNYLWSVVPQFRGKDLNTLANEMRPVERRSTDGNKMYGMSEGFRHLRRLSKLRFRVQHRGKEQNTIDYAIMAFEFAEKYGAEGATPKNVKINDKDGKEISLYDYFVARYNFRTQYPNWPMVLTAKAGLFPVDACTIAPMQRYPYKLLGDETANMIKGAVTRPDKRKADIMQAKNMLGWSNDPYLRQFGLKFDENFTRTEGRLLPNPVIQFANGNIDPKTSGRWDLRGKKFWLPNVMPLDSWGFMIIENSCSKQHASAFAATFRQTYIGHGGIIKGDPVIIDSQARNPNSANAVENGIGEIRRKTGKPVQMLFVIIRHANSGNYERVKKSADCRFGVLTQVVLSRHVEKNQGQYHSNVAMKVNAKLGGTTCRVPHPNAKAPRGQPPFFSEPTMIMGVDVSHAGAGVNSPSMAAMTMSMDKDACRYAAVCQTNGYRVEMLSPSNTNEMLTKLVRLWMTKLGSTDPPRHIYFFRDGVSEGQFSQVIDIELAAIKAFFREKFGHKMPKFTVIIATKRHHIRFFPARGKGDKNNNPHPGTLLENEVCHPFQWDFYLCAHSAIQGTARPVHYHVLIDEAKVDHQKLQQMIYQHSYQYARSTTPVSLHPAVYYADLAAGRARAHESVATSDGFRAGPKGQEMAQGFGMHEVSMGGPERGAEAAPLIPMGGNDALEVNRNFIRSTMWYI
ncbi:hypothetical protein VDGD_10484 [Verticillium dahliae]|nr:hypothetical protein VdG1_04838 [Verticillium dahliae VDG1]RBQ97101.1 hypothetical protein VDGD_10484 [Verticillium dahliae]